MKTHINPNEIDKVIDNIGLRKMVVTEKGGVLYPKEKGKAMGRPAGAKNREISSSALLDSIARVEKKLKINFLDHLVTRAIKSSDKLMVSLLKKVLPDLTKEIGEQYKSINIIRVENKEPPTINVNTEVKPDAPK